MVNRRQFITSSALCGFASLLPWQLAAKDPEILQQSIPSNYKQLVETLLHSWCDGMLKHQINAPLQPDLHGALWCPACQKIHGRCMDAVYPFMHMAHKTGDKKYLDAAILSMQWSKNVSKEDGSWTVIPDPNSWPGITVFGAIALAEALHYHSEILPKKIAQQWRERLKQAANYIYQTFDLEFTNINYGGTAIYALLLMGEALNEPKYIARSHELAKGIKAYFTTPNKLLFGEGKPSKSKSAKGLFPVDLGYNVEETLNALVLYALHENDSELLTLLEKSLNTHLAFMLPDGAWDNSWGTRQAKWSYWGSRTTDGSQPAFGLMAEINPAFGTAAYLNTELLATCTADGLLHGGIHYVSHGVLPCIHHTFAHAKPLAFMLDFSKKKPDLLSKITKDAPLPRSKEYGVKHFKELDVWLVAFGNWQATVSAYDSLYKENNQTIQQATGGALSVVWHELTGPLMIASMPKYQLVEKNNQQPQPDNEDIALTPRLESYDKQGNWFTNLYDLSANVESKQHADSVMFNITTQLKNEQSNTLNKAQQPYTLNYTFSNNQITISAMRQQAALENESLTRLVLPIIATNKEPIKQLADNKIAIAKENAVIVIESNFPINQRKTARARVFNMVPGMEAIVLDTLMTTDANKAIVCTIKITT